MKSIALSCLIISCTYAAAGQQTDTLSDRMPAYFKDAAAATKQHTAIWGKDLYGPILLVNPETRQIYANQPDSAGQLKKQGQIYTGTLPAKINVSNTALHWEGRNWAMIMLPLPEIKEDRVDLMTHELFHNAQASLQFNPADPLNNHLNKKDGRIYLRLELAALQKALHATTTSSRNHYLTVAITFRQYRYLLYPGADTTENALELNEGLAQYTGLMMSGRNKAQIVTLFDNNIAGFLQNPSFVRSFAYHTTPKYGYLLSQTKPGWTREIKNNTSLTQYFIQAFQLNIPADVKTAVTANAAEFDGNTIIAAETERDIKLQQQIAAYIQKFVTQPHTELRFEKMNIVFDPRSMVPVDGHGTVYPKIRVTDKWGILTVSEGALMSSNWDKITVGLPQTLEDKKISGAGWELQLNEGYKMIKDDTGSYHLQKK